MGVDKGSRSFHIIEKGISVFPPKRRNFFMLIPLGLSYDDVLLVPQKTDVRSRSEVDTSTFLTKNLRINIPVVSANMDTVTESEMAVTMALNGGIGIIHRFLTIEEQAAEVARVKRYDGFLVDDPHTLSPDDTLEKAYKLIEYYGSTGFVVVDAKKKVLGVLSKRDFIFPNLIPRTSVRR